MRFRKAVFVVTYRKEPFLERKLRERRNKKNKVLYLLLKRKLHWKGWEFVKGGGAGLAAVEREVREETGQKATNIKKYKLKGEYKYNEKLADRPGIIGQTWQLYSCEIKNKKVRLDKKEHSSYKWKSYKQALKMLTYDNQKKCLRFVNSKLSL